MVHSAKKGFLALALVSTLGLSAGSEYREDKTGMPIREQSSKTKQAAVLAASVAANVAAIVAMHAGMAYIAPLIGGSFGTREYTFHLAKLISQVGLVEASNYLINKMGLSTDRLWLYGLTFNPASYMIERSVKEYIQS